MSLTPAGWVPRSYLRRWPVCGTAWNLPVDCALLCSCDFLHLWHSRCLGSEFSGGRPPFAVVALVLFKQVSQVGLSRGPRDKFWDSSCLSALGRSTGGWATFPVFLATLQTLEQDHCWSIAVTGASPGAARAYGVQGENRQKEWEREKKEMQLSTSGARSWGVCVSICVCDILKKYSYVLCLPDKEMSHSLNTLKPTY